MVQNIRGPFPDSVPDDLIAAYGQQARHTVRYRRSWRYRQARRIGRLLGGRSPVYVTAATLLWITAMAGFGASFFLAALRWPAQVIDASVLVAVAALSSFLTAVVVWRRASRRRP
jgi:hypothetical protein